ncbi:DUF1722 domain-containing protein [Vibrio sp. ZSDZ34]|uniref:DUF1722 domain-containing protein n=1 Tax=Vibrio gelatinilyticus TaxID=2893468 RepID=A0A9X1WCY2_9VIBR|nr:DUF523 and DUF1722 domain-containing protein [Vibrio gelatinilyticus]MCJ2376170.1 DUF1722 domain-containing protein [Vibrio gelatinilyticus]
MRTIVVGISSCLLGEKVRFDSGHKQSSYVNQELSAHFTFKSVCPEVSIGLSVPRPTIRLMSDDERIRLVESKDSSKDYTDKMETFSRDKVSELASQDLCGYIVCAKSPTCGMERVKVYTEKHATTDGIGIYTRQLMKKMPWLPIEEDGRLNDPVLKENFVARVFALNDFYQSMDGSPSAGKIVAFHSRYKLVLMANHPESYKSLGSLVAKQHLLEPEDFAYQYRTGFMNALKNRSSRKTTTNVLMHIQGYFKRDLTASEKSELARVIDDYRTGLLPILAPLTLLKHYLEKYPNDYLHQQKFLQPHPEELRLRYGL